MRLTERDRELDYLQELLVESARSGGRIAIVSGPAGTGKTALLHIFSECVTDFGGRHLTAVGSRAEQGVPMGLLRQLLQSIPREPELSSCVAKLLDKGTRFPACSEGPST